MRHFIKPLIIMLFAFCSLTLSQIGGKIYLAEEANQLYGKVDFSVNLNAELFVKILNKTDNRIMFKFIDNELFVFGDGRKVLYANSFKPISKSMVLHSFDVSIFKRFMEKNSENNISVELRGKVLTLTKGNYTLEYATPCPPFCD